MNHRVTSTDLILEKALLIAKREGVDKLSIRKLATACGIAVGSVYNYYPDKEALVTAMAEVFWNNIFSDQERLYHHGTKWNTGLLQRLYRTKITHNIPKRHRTARRLQPIATRQYLCPTNLYCQTVCHTPYQRCVLTQKCL